MIRSGIVSLAVILLAYSGHSVIRKLEYNRRVNSPMPAIMRPFLDRSAAAGRGAVVVLFSADDCPDLAETFARLEHWQQAGVTNVVAFRVGNTQATARQEQLFGSVPKRIRVESIDHLDASVIADGLRYSSTPFVVIIDTLGRVAGSFRGDRIISEESLIRAQRGIIR